jgi:hypothetical protein
MRKLVLSVLVVVLGFVSTPLLARAGNDDAEVTRMAKEHYKQGLEAYQSGNYPTAIKELKKAYLLKRLPALLLNIGATYRKMNDNDNAISYYKKYLTEAPDAKDHADVEKIVAELQSGGAREASPPADKPAEAPDEPRATAAAGWSHTPVDAAPPDTPVDVRVSMPVMKGVKVYLYYRESGAPEFSAVVMKRKGTEKVGRIPATAMNGKSIQYYIEAKDDKGNVINKAGSPSDPNIVMIDPNARPVMIAGEGESAPAATDSKSAHADLDDEAAPIMGQVAREESARHAKSAKGPHLGGAFYAGLVLVAAGAALVGTGTWALLQAKSYADALSADSAGNNGMPYKFNDPMAQPYDDKTVEQRGRNYNTLGIAMTVAGGVAAVAGVVLIAVDRTVLNKRATEKPRRSAWYVAPALSPSYAGVGGGVTF